jgi:small redox-active disulfide protein 2
MKIEVIGSGCAKCKQLYERVKNIVESNDLEAEVIYLPDANELIERGILGSPAVVVDGELVLIGSLASDTELFRLIRGA